MKLNLLPQTVSTANKAKSAWIGSILIAILGIAAGVGLTIISQGRLAAATEQEGQLRPQAQAVVSLAAQADPIIARSADLVRNTTLANDMIQHNTRYTRLYDKVLRGVPSFFRITTISAQPTGADTAVITMDGVLQTYKQYSDLALSLLRIEGVTSIARSGYVDRSLVVPNLTEVDQYGRPRDLNAAPIPDNELDRLAYYEALGRTTAFDGTGGFGDPVSTLRSAGPESSYVRMVINISGTAIQPPDIRTMLSSSGGATAAPGGAAPAGAPFGGAPGGVPAAAGGQGDDDR
jgi:hypothetical protein